MKPRDKEIKIKPVACFSEKRLSNLWAKNEEVPAVRLSTVQTTPNNARGKLISIRRGWMSQAKIKVAEPIRDENKIKFRNLECSINEYLRTLKISLNPFFLFLILYSGSYRVIAAGMEIRATNT